jgi:hypothetical protein
MLYRIGYGVSNCKTPTVNVHWHVRTGDIELHKDTSYYDTLLRNLLTVLSAKKSDIGKRIRIAFESQKSVPFLTKLIPAAKFHVGRDIVDAVCGFLTSDIFVSSGSSFAVLLAFAPRNRPVIFEEVRKEVMWNENHGSGCKRGAEISSKF